MTSLVQIKNVSIDYLRAGRSASVVRAVRGLSAEIVQNERTVFLGPSGCGKSSVLSAVAGFVPISDGEICVAGHPVSKPSFERVMVFQGFDQLLPWKSVVDNVEFALKARWPKMARHERRERALHYVTLVGLAGQAEQFPHTLSGGQKQLAAIARAFALEPDLLLMDEPFGSLDAINRDRMQQELLRIWEERRTTLVFVTHDVAEAVRIGHRIIVFSKGPQSKVREVIDNRCLNDGAATAQLIDNLRDLLVPESEMSTVHEEAQ
ncbi:ABC transporter ATP-binding protein [Dactylosporangium fulvum]|uniref:ATP-binding cassette domain-containing protein n=1 Tax=Dactylosporangium fulvum TaxID=53359 RepID=A0ABY5VRK2_9ACTN|nr:ATP-binding cassette domain-containing protein [Dactylosporangium fulvum]UWP80402.1 ATP-binding cassette domain-containing protein [Dactylosporangium fulvum]